MAELKHATVLLKGAVAGLNVQSTGTYVDATLGDGGHTQAILQQLVDGHLYLFNQDQTTVNYNREQLKTAIEQQKLTSVEGNFRNLKTKLNSYSVKRVDGILYDLDVSSPQSDDAKGGFSYQHDTSLDTRVNQEQKLSAMEVINEWSYERLVKILYRYGEGKFARSIARKIEQRRKVAPIKTTFELVDVIKEGIPAAARRRGGHPAEKSFQAIRIAVNDELGALKEPLEQALDLSDVGGRVSIITFQSLKDQSVRTMLREKASLDGDVPQGLPVIPTGMEPDFKLINKKPIVASEEKLTTDHRAHSIKLRMIEKIREGK